MINDSKRWTFSEYTVEGIGVISKWIDGLDDEVQAEFEVRLLQWAANDKWLDIYSGAVGTIRIDKYGDRFEELTKTRDIAVVVNEVLYRILGGHFAVDEFAMLIGYSDDNRRSETPDEIKEWFQERLADLRQNRHHRRKYELE